MIVKKRLLPDDVIARLIELRDSVTSNYFEVGHIVNSACLNRGVEVGKVIREVSRYFGRSQSRVRRYADVESAFGTIHDNYPLSFSHWEYAYKLRNDLEKLDAYLKYACEHPGTTPLECAIASGVANASKSKSPSTMIDILLRNAMQAAANNSEDAPAEDENEFSVQDAPRLFMFAVSRLISMIRRVADNFDDATQKKVYRLTDELQDVALDLLTKQQEHGKIKTVEVSRGAIVRRTPKRVT